MFTEIQNPIDFFSHYQNTSDAWNQLVDYAMKDSINLRKIPDSDRVNIEEQMKAYLARFRWRTEGFYEVYNQYDPAVKKALEVLEK